MATMSALALALSVLLVACGARLAGSSSTSSDLNCSLPVTALIKNGGNSESQSGFVSVPSGTFTPDPAGTYGPAYDWTSRRWLPVLPSQVLADGTMYAYEVELQDRPGYQIHMVWVPNSSDKMVLDMPYDKAYSILALKPEGIYLVPILHRSGVPGGLWLLSSTKATLTAVPGAGDSRWQVIEGGAAWGGHVDRDSLDRLDLSTGAVTTWFRHPIEPAQGIGSSNGPEVVGFDSSGRPLIEFVPASATAPEVWLVSSPGEATKLTGLPLPSVFLQKGVTDTHGTWLVGADGFYLYAAGRFQRAAPMPPGPVGDFAVAGSCN